MFLCFNSQTSYDPETLAFLAAFGSLDFGGRFLENEQLSSTPIVIYQLDIFISFKKMNDLNAYESFKATKLAFVHLPFIIEVHGGLN